MNKKATKSLTFEELRVKNLKRCEEVFHPLHDWSETDYTCACLSELGEMGNFIKKRRRKDFKTDDYLDDIYKEIGDVICYLDLIATKFGFRLEDCTRDKFNIISNRKKSKIKL